MGRILLFIAGLAILSFVTYRAMGGTATATTEGPSAPKRQLDNVRAKAKQIEIDGQQAADRAALEPAP